MPRTQTVGSRLRELREQRGISALALSKRAGLGVNYVRQLERSGRYPNPEKLMAVARALDLEGATIAELRHLAGIDPDPASAPEGKAARRDAWPLLLYVLANHVLLPRLQLADLLKRKRPLGTNDQDLIRRAVQAPDMASFVEDVASAPGPARGLASLLEDVFHAVPPADIAPLQRRLHNILNSRKHGDVYLWDERWGAALTLLSFNRPPLPETLLFEYVHHWTFDYSFAVCFFPALYWQACRLWPFEKAVIPYAARGSDVQRRLYDAVAAGMSLSDLDRALLGQGALGEEIRNSPRARPSPEDREEVAADGEIWVELPLQTKPGHVTRSQGRRPPTDAVFDHLDRCEFLERFPIIKVDRASFGDLARSISLPSWHAWTDFIRRRTTTHTGTPSTVFTDEAAPLSPERFVSVLFHFHQRLASEPDPYTLDSHLARIIVEQAAQAMARRLGKRDWPAVAAAAKILGLPQDWQRVVDALARRHPDSDSDRSQQ